MPSVAYISHITPEICPLRTDKRTDVLKFPPVFYRTLALWGRCPKTRLSTQKYYY